MRARPRSRTTVLVAAIAAGLALATAPSLPAAATPPAPGSTKVLSLTTASTPITSYGVKAPSISSDGRYVVFESKAPGLTAIPNGMESQVYISDTVSDTLTMVSSFAGKAGGDRSTQPAISADGRFVTFSTMATNLGMPIDGHTSQVVLWSRQTGEFRLVSSAPGATPVPGNSDAITPAISSDGSIVAFASAATNLSAVDSHGIQQVYRRNMNSGELELVSVDSRAGSRVASGSVVREPSLSADGRLIGFVTAAQLGAVPTGGFAQGYVYDSNTKMADLVTRNVSKTTGGTGDVTSFSLAASGTVAVAESAATDLIAGSLSPRVGRIFTVDVRTSLATIQSVDTTGNPVEGHMPAISGDGRFVAFSSVEAKLDEEVRNDPRTSQLYLRDTTAGTNVMVSVSGTGTAASDYIFGSTIQNDPLPAAISNEGAYVAFASSAYNIDDRSDKGVTQAYIRATSSPSEVVRLEGADRFAASAAISDYSFGANSSGFVYIASGETFADALSAGAAAGAAGGPVLLTNRDSLPTSVVTALARLNPRYIKVVGGRSSIADSVVAQLKAQFPMLAPERLEGPDRFATSATVSKATFLGGAPVAYVSSGETFPDALSASAAAGREHAPVLLTGRDRLPDSVKDELTRLKPKRIVLTGGSATIADSVLAELNKIAPTARVAGVDRYAGSAALSSGLFPRGVRTVFVASGEVYPDALSGSAAAIARQSPLLLVQRDGIPTAIASELTRLSPTKIVVLGGPSTVTDRVLTELRGYLRS